MKRAGQVIFCLLMVMLFAYLVLFDYPALKQRLTPVQDDVDELMSQEMMKSEESNTVTEQEESQSVQTTDQTGKSNIDALRAQIPATQAILFTGSIRETIYTDFYPIFQKAGYTGTLLFTNSHLTGDYAQMETAEYQEMVDAGWDYAMGGIDNNLSIEEWQASLNDEVERIRQRSGRSPFTYYFQAGEYQPEREAALVKEGFAALYYSADDSSAVDAVDADIKRICCITFSDDDKDIQEALDQAWQYDSVALCLTVDSDDASTAEKWSAILAALDKDDRFSIVGQSDWLNSTHELDAERADKVSAVLQAGDE